METKVQEQKVSSKFAEGKCQICGKPVYNDEIGSTCKAHQGKIGLFYKPAPANVKEDKTFIAIGKFCDKAEELGKSRGFAVKLTGGDAGTKSPEATVFTVYQLGKLKFLKVGAIAALEALLKSK
jgi:hypothetical protein